MSSSDPSTLPEAAAAERLRQHLEEIAGERDKAHRALQEREAELARIQRIARIGGLEIDFRDGVKNRRSPEYLLVHGLPPEAVDANAPRLRSPPDGYVTPDAEDLIWDGPDPGGGRVYFVEAQPICGKAQGWTDIGRRHPTANGWYVNSRAEKMPAPRP